MKKIKLNLDELKVESFETANNKMKLGTVKGEGDTANFPKCQSYADPLCELESLPNCETAWDYTCNSCTATQQGATCLNPTCGGGDCTDSPLLCP